jgi:hypothetical protein
MKVHKNRKENIESGQWSYALRGDDVEELYAIRCSSGKFDLVDAHGVVKLHAKLLKECKDYVRSLELERAASTSTFATEAEQNMAPTWDSVHPCAWLVLIGRKVRYSDQAHQDLLLHTLDNWGWLDESGKPDVERAEQELARIRASKVRTNPLGD